MDALAEEFAGRAKVFKVDAHTEWDITVQYGITSIPNLMFFKDGKVADQIIGAVPKSVLAAKLQKLLDA